MNRPNRYLLGSNVLMHVVNKASGYGLVETRLPSARADTVLVECDHLI